MFLFMLAVLVVVAVVKRRDSESFITARKVLMCSLCGRWCAHLRRCTFQPCSIKERSKSKRVYLLSISFEKRYKIYNIYQRCEYIYMRYRSRKYARRGNSWRFPAAQTKINCRRLRRRRSRCASGQWNNSYIRCFCSPYVSHSAEPLAATPLLLLLRSTSLYTYICITYTCRCACVCIYICIRLYDVMLTSQGLAESIV